MATKKLSIKLVDGGHFYKGYVESLFNQLDHDVKFVTNDNPDLLVFSVFGKENEKYNCKKLLLVGEAWRSYPKCDLRIDACTEPGTVYVPHYIPSFHERKSIRRDALTQLKPKYEKKKFCAFLASYDVEPRNTFFDLLCKYKRVDGLGKSKKNTDVSEDRDNLWYYDSAVEKYKDYKFVICFENTSKDGYVTEKIVNAMLAGAIPIYWGDPNVTKHFNPKSFINVHDFKDLSAVVDQVKEIDENDQLYKAMLAEPWLADSNPVMSDDNRIAIC
jgi:alpha(1,3/1,4) fucosyltransferase